MNQQTDIISVLQNRFGTDRIAVQPVCDTVPTVWVTKNRIREVLRFLKTGVEKPFVMLFDMTVIDERLRENRTGQPDSDFTVVYYLISLDRNADIRLKVALDERQTALPSIVDIWPSADWYEREAWDMFGIDFDGHPHMRRILLPQTWTGHPLRKEHPARATEMAYFQLPPEKQAKEEEALRFNPEEWGMKCEDGNTDTMFLNLGPQHPGTHGLLRLVLQLDGEEIVDAVPEIGFHHRGAEKMAERQTWHTYIPYTDRIDYLGGVMNNLPYLLAVEKLAGIEVPDRVKVIRIMMAELYRIASHLVFYGTFSQDVGMMSPVFYMFTDRERVFDITTAITGGRMHPMWFRIGGVAQDLPEGWDSLIRDFLTYMDGRLREYESLVLKNRILRKRTRGIGIYDLNEALDWGVTGPNLRACGLEWDLRKKRPYSGYEQFEFDIPIGSRGDVFDRAVMRAEEIRQSLRIIAQCVDNMPAGSHKADHPLAVPPRKERTLHDIETLITHFLAVSWGPVIPPGEAMCFIEATKGWNGYYLVSDGGIHSYRTRIRTPSFAHLQTLPGLIRGLMVPDVLAILGSIDYVLADVDR